MIEEIQNLMREENNNPYLYSLFFFASLIEYVFPPFPGDTVVLFGAFLAASAQIQALYLWLSCTFASTLGSGLLWRLGLFLKTHQHQWPSFLQSQKAKESLKRIDLSFSKHGHYILILSRFIPVSRSFFFIGAGLSKMPLSVTLLWGTISAALWNASLILIAYQAEANWDKIQHIYENYALLLLSLTLLVILFYFIKMKFRKTIKK